MREVLRVELHEAPSYITSEYVLDTEGLEGDLGSIITLEWDCVDLATSAWSVHYGLISYYTKSIASLLIGEVFSLGKSFLDKSDVDMLETH